MDHTHRDHAQSGAAAAGPKDALSLRPGEKERILREWMDRHYHQTLDQPLSTLDNQSPRQAVRTAAGRRKTVEWLKYLENASAHGRAAGDMAGYDFGWMWQELGLTTFRK
ncbi:hypothetical protein [Nguyenibacter sp. L1]|uniref:hypothetical protein n=1 Tax=Nguyenibacter sp. L1 TaxID=3049350 RepID=UPI002B4911CA|nr:hypothetical protein [Nguyenibacter sp. L1]WRH88758.1 hypothetical protein QN315_03800 [Nguyenibacter sp. L1]